jgi:phage head maturation protease
VSIPANRNITQKEAEEKIKYKRSCNQVQQIWNIECMITPVITGATVVVTKDLKRNLEAAPRRHSIDSLQKAANGTSHVVREVLQSET